MKEKKSVQIDGFDNFGGKQNSFIVDKFYNVCPGKKLTASNGVGVAKFPQNLTNANEYELNLTAAGIENVQGVTYFKQYFTDAKETTHRLLVYGDDEKVYINQMLDDSYNLYWLYEMKFNNPPVALAYKKNDEDAIVLASSDSMKIWKTNYSPYTIEDVPIITSMCMNEGILFCTIKQPAFKIWYATDLDAENIGNISANSGFISLEDSLGDARKVVTFNEDVYVFRDYGISKINLIQGNMTTSQVYLSNTKIYSNTVSVCGNQIMFMTNDGLYTFNGIKVSKMEVDLLNDLLLNNDKAVASSLGEKYYLALKLNFNDGQNIFCEDGECVNNAILVVDFKDFNYQIIRGVDVKSFVPIKTGVFEKMLVVFNSGYTQKLGQIREDGKLFDENLPKMWSCKKVVDDLRTKLFTKLTVYANKDVRFTLKHDNRTTDFVTYTSGLNEFAFKICCKEMDMTITSSDEMLVDKIVLDYYEY